MQSRFRKAAGGQELGDKSKSSALVKGQRQEAQKGQPDCSKRATRERGHVTILFWAKKIVCALFTYQASDVFELQTGTGRKDFACHDRQCEDKLNRKTLHFRWPSVAQISSLSAQHTRSSNQRDWKERYLLTVSSQREIDLAQLQQIFLKIYNDYVWCFL